MNTADLSRTSKPRSGGPTRSTILLTILAVASVILPFTVWRQTWFGSPLSDREIEEYLRSTDRPRRIQHALSRIAERLAQGDQAPSRWYPEIVALAEDPRPEVRNTVAWAMGQDNRSEVFHRELLTLLEDPEPTVRHNAALSLIRFGDESGRGELVSLLQGNAVRSPSAGTVSILLKAGSEVGARTLIARVESPGMPPTEVRSPIAGRLDTIYTPNGAEVSRDDALALIRPESSQVWEALRGLYLIGRAEDLPAVVHYEDPVPGMSTRIHEQARLTSDAIRARAEGAVPR